MRELNHVLKNTYFSRKNVNQFLNVVLTAKKLVGDDSCAFWKNVRFLDIQAGGNSQREMLALFDKLLKKKCDFGIAQCGKIPEAYFYLDDAIFTGNRVRGDLEKWLKLDAPKDAKLHIATIALHIPRYLAVVLHSEIGRTQFKASEYGGTKQGLGLGDVKSAIVPLPSKEEQEKICDVIDRELAGLSRTISTTEKEISLLREYGTRLIADVVTGKLDVREAARQLPNDVGERDEPIQANEGEETEIKEAVFAGAADG